MHICTECGHVSEEDMDFCPRCGSKKGTNLDEGQIPPQFKVVQRPTGTVIVKLNVMKLRAALFLALLPGIVDVFGLGHLVMGKYLRGILFLSCSAFYYYEKYIGYFGLSYWQLFGFSMAIFVIQTLDIFRIIRAEVGIGSP